LGRKAERVAAAVKRIEAAEQRLVHEDRVPVPRLTRRELALELEDGVIGVGAGEKIEHSVDAGEERTALFERIDGVGEGRLRRIGGDRLDLGGMLGKGASERLIEMLRFNRGEWRDAERAAPVLD